jgi:hypothetical protein
MIKRLAAAAVLLALATCEPNAAPADDLPTMPNPALTPGAVETTDAGQVCAPGYAKAHRHVPTVLRDHVFAAYRVPLSDGYRVELDHLVPLELGGASVAANLWPEAFSGPLNARIKDQLENRLHTLVCAGQLPLEQAQHEIASNWIAAHRRYVGTPGE